MNNYLFLSSSDKYELVATLGTGNFGTVYLVRHRILECLRAIKVIPKTRAHTDSQLSEARLLKSLHHPGIPIIYEIEEDNDYYYLIEEYVEGESLEAYLLNQTHISQTIFYDFSLQICEIFRYLHNIRPDPILYMDLKPEHIIVHDGKLKLIDFNVSVSLKDAGNLCNLYGNLAYSAPEIKAGATPHPKWDIYAIGKILLFLTKFTLTPLPFNTQKILKKAAANDPACRYETVDELSCAIAKEQNNHQELSCKTIAVVGSNFGCGTTHIAISLVSSLNFLGYPACYYETGKRNNLHVLKDHLSNIKETNGYLQYKYFLGLPNYGPGILVPTEPNRIRVCDYGSCFTRKDESIFEADLILYICSSGVLKWQQVLDKNTFLSDMCGNLKIICNMGQNQDLKVYAQNLRKPVYSYSFDSDPFRITKEKCRFFSKLLQLKPKRRNRLFFYFKKLRLQNKF